jgi:hypothetical protein
MRYSKIIIGKLLDFYIQYPASNKREKTFISRLFHINILKNACPSVDRAAKMFVKGREFDTPDLDPSRAF